VNFDDDQSWPRVVFSPQERRAAWVTIALAFALAVLVFRGPVPIAVPAMGWFVIFAYIHERDFRYA
jgi:hypothetical protein